MNNEDVIIDLAQHIPDPARTTLLASFDKLKTYSVMYDTVAALPKDLTNVEKSWNFVLNLNGDTVSVLSYCDQNESPVHGDTIKTILRHLRKAAENGGALVMHFADLKVKTIMEALQAAVDEVVPWQGGIHNGNWLDGLAAQKHETWKPFWNHAQQTIMKEPQVAKLKTKLLALRKAGSGVGVSWAGEWDGTNGPRLSVPTLEFEPICVI